MLAYGWMRVCITCNQEKPLSEYSRSRPLLDGLCRRCRECQREYMRNYRAVKKAEIAGIGRPAMAVLERMSEAELDALRDRFTLRTARPQGTECVQWQMGTNSKGYGTTSVCSGGVDVGISAHKLAYLLFRGPVPDGLHVCHSCDNPPCVKPEHLWLGTNDQNQDDKIAKGRQKGAPGERNASAKTNEATVREIRAMYATGEWTQTALGMRFGMRQDRISDIV